MTASQPATEELAALHIYLLGSLRVIWQGKPFTLNTLPKNLALLTYLLLHSDRLLPRSDVDAALWPDMSDAEARANLRRHLFDLRQALPPETPPTPWLLTTAASVQAMTLPEAVDVALGSA